MLRQYMVDTAIPDTAQEWNWRSKAASEHQPATAQCERKLRYLER
jgi:hypothetical protein